jgi:hypothetical protein
MHELCGVKTGNFDNFNWKSKPSLGSWGEDPKKFVKKVKIWHLLRGIALWMIQIERNDKVFNHEQWHDLIMYAKAA